MQLETIRLPLNEIPVQAFLQIMLGYFILVGLQSCRGGKVPLLPSIKSVEQLPLLPQLLY